MWNVVLLGAILVIGVTYLLQVHERVQYLLDRREEFATAVTEKLLIYALGRGLEYYDQPAVRKIVRAAAPEYRWSSIVLGVVRSAPFRMRRAES